MNLKITIIGNLWSNLLNLVQLYNGMKRPVIAYIISPFWQNFKSLWYIFEVCLVFGQILNHTDYNFIFNLMSQTKFSIV